MAASFEIARFGISSLPAFISLILLVVWIGSATAAPSSDETEGFFNVSDLPPPPPLELSGDIEPLFQTNIIFVTYPGTIFIGVPDHVSYTTHNSIFFKCTRRTTRIAVSVNPEWELYVDVRKWVESPEIGKPILLEIEYKFYNSKEETLIIQTKEAMETEGDDNVIHELLIGTVPYYAIDEDDRFGIQAFKSGDNIITIGLSPKPNSIRRFIPCIDDPAVRIPHLWSVTVNYGNVHPPAVVLMNGQRNTTRHFCGSDPGDRSSVYDFATPDGMPAAEMQFKIVPFDWHKDESLPPVAECQVPLNVDGSAI